MTSKVAAHRSQQATRLQGNIAQQFQLFKPSNSNKFHVRFSAGGRQIRKALGTYDEQEAKRIAERVYYESLILAEQGVDARGLTIKSASEEWLKTSTLTQPERSAFERYILCV
ncbi:hypothetical protein LOC54_09275 [Acetobacter sp. AN02]|uniref:hypothetical protein n=1 Tax=Acetobacter sp. AN02 TaxID=2894186 RepID=UPI0024342B4A|nr:hypothetical protein [Acetobacter sp. AN02]MDG6095291.1 hypothetical protein [Acetobacter sp. AN02]